LYEALEVALAPHVDSKRQRALDQHGFDGLLIDGAATPIRFPLRVLSNESQAGKMSAKLGPATA
jgi:hypothetical protein